MKYRTQEHYKQTNEILNTGTLQTNKQMKYRIEEHYKQTDEITNKGTLQTNR
jgi:hypothetical protein